MLNNLVLLNDLKQSDFYQVSEESESLEQSSLSASSISLCDELKSFLTPSKQISEESVSQEKKLASSVESVIQNKSLQSQQQ